MVWVKTTLTKDQEYVQISYSPNKSGYDRNIGPSEDTWEKAEAKV